MDEALDIIDRLWRGETITQDGYFTCKDLKLHTLPERRPPIWVSAFGPEAAKVAARRGDGFWTLADPERVPDLLEVYRAECDDAGKRPGEIVLHAGFSWAPDEDSALEAVRKWKGAQPDDVYRDDIHVPGERLRARRGDDLRRGHEGGLHRRRRPRRAHRADPRDRSSSARRSSCSRTTRAPTRTARSASTAGRCFRRCAAPAWPRRRGSSAAGRSSAAGGDGGGGAIPRIDEVDSARRRPHGQQSCREPRQPALSAACRARPFRAVALADPSERGDARRGLAAILQGDELDAFARHPLMFGPSPVHRLERLSAHLGGAELWAKRDDCNSGLAFGGNKTRKLEYLVADALARAATRSSRSAGCSPTTRARSPPPRRAPGSAACWCRSAGSTGPTSSTTASATSSSAA